MSEKTAKTGCHRRVFLDLDDVTEWDVGITGGKYWPRNNLLALPGAVQTVVPALPGSRFRYLAVVIQIFAPEPGITDGPGIGVCGTSAAR